MYNFVLFLDKSNISYLLLLCVLCWFWFRIRFDSSRLKSIFQFSFRLKVKCHRVYEKIDCYTLVFQFTAYNFRMWFNSMAAHNGFHIKLKTKSIIWFPHTHTLDNSRKYHLNAITSHIISDIKANFPRFFLQLMVFPLFCTLTQSHAYLD